MDTICNHYTIQSILLADDDRDDHLIFHSALMTINPELQLERVSDGMELLTLLNNYIPNLLFVKMDMPRKNGLECLKVIRQYPTLNALPMVVFSSTTRTSNIESAYEMGADLFFIKPVAYADLVSAITALLALNWSDRQKVKEQYLINGRHTAFM